MILLGLGQSCCLMGARSPEAPTVYPQATKISNRELEQVPKTYDSTHSTLLK